LAAGEKNMTGTFAKIGIHDNLVKGLGSMGITRPTRIQTEMIPPILAGRDVIGQSETGTDKTPDYLLPLFQKIDTDKASMQAIILAPTHELSMQIFRQVQLLADKSGYPATSTVIIGDVNILRQIEKLKDRPHIIIGSSGRILELIQKRKINAQTVKTIVLDEADRLLEDNNRSSVGGIIKSTQKDRQLLLVSATITSDALAKAGEWTKDPVVVAVQDKPAIPAEIAHVYFLADSRDKIEVLRKLSASLNLSRILVFINTSAAIEATVSKLAHHGIAVAGLHGSAVKFDRQASMEAFRAGRAQILIASDLAARGLDIPGVECVVSLELPENPQDYLHRAGRTGRAGQKGLSVLIVDKQEAKQIAGLQKKLQIRIESKAMAHGEIVDSISQPNKF